MSIALYGLPSKMLVYLYSLGNVSVVSALHFLGEYLKILDFYQDTVSLQASSTLPLRLSSGSSRP